MASKKSIYSSLLLLTLTLGAFVPVTSFADDGIATMMLFLHNQRQIVQQQVLQQPQVMVTWLVAMIQTQVRQRQQHQHLQFLKYQLNQQHQQLQKHLRHRLQQLIHQQNQLINQLRNQPISQKNRPHQLIKGQVKQLKPLKLQQ